MIQQRNIALCVLLTFVTCGIYGLYWFVCLTNEANQLSGDNQTSGGMALFLTLITCGIYGWFWAYKMGDKIDQAKRYRGVQSSNSGAIYLILFIVSAGLIAYILMQSEINNLVSNNNNGYKNF